MLRVHFTADDLARVRIAASADPLWEMLLSAHLLQKQDGSVLFDAWRQRSRVQVRQLGAELAGFALLLRLMPPYGYSPDFLTPAAGTVDLASGVDVVLSVPRRRIAAELSRLAATRPLPSEAAKLASGDAATTKRLGQAMHRFHEVVLAPYWPQIAAQITADRAKRAESMLSGGVDYLLRKLISGAKWEPPVWHLPFYRDDDLHLDGRGLLLVPSFFCWHEPTRLLDPTLPPALAYPITRQLSWLAPQDLTPGLIGLLGATRAAVLDCIARAPASTSEIARRTGISIPSASLHASALREAGLLIRFRRGRSVQHVITGLGLDLLNRS